MSTKAEIEASGANGHYTYQVIALAYAAGYNAGVADGAPVTERRARTIADEQIAKALDGLTVEVKR
ncbi:hypothetical protein D2E60_21725 [Mycobacteroides abscessus]|uniref:hypothetical protein n=1 Tax=Mycobacteroides abscessus TaxID=36809 RepID=UPI000E678E5D|nr:hypothetical protein [Mycobacteroides abscessus]RIS38547.1 hypothetical protein D2E60_21725 [Mycobacteroides abscessus]